MKTIKKIKCPKCDRSSPNYAGYWEFQCPYCGHVNSQCQLSDWLPKAI